MRIDRPGLAQALRRARARVTPEIAGIPAGRGRRVPGLRREELAMLAGISVDYVVRLEQGRGPRPSPQVLSALGRALRLDPAGRDELFYLAGEPPPTASVIELHVRPSVLRLIDRFVDLPTLVLSAKGDVLAWNAMSSALLGDWSALPPARRNIVRMRFLPDPGDPPRGRVGAGAGEQKHTALQAVSSLRSAAARYPHDTDLRALLDDLRSGSPEFAALWDEAPAGGWRNHTKTVQHATLGEITLDCDTLHVPDADQSVIVYSATPGTPAAEALALLRVLGTQDLAAVGDPVHRR